MKTQSINGGQCKNLIVEIQGRRISYDLLNRQSEDYCLYMYLFNYCTCKYTNVKIE